MALKFVSSLEKCFLSDNIADKATFAHGSFLKNERFHLGVCFTANDPDAPKRAVTLRVVSPLAAYVAVRKVVHVPVRMTCNPGETVADDYITTAPGLFPDMLVPLAENGQLFLQKNLESLFLEIDTKGAVAAGDYPLTVQLVDGDETVEEATCTLTVIGAALPPQTLKFTQWFYCDCLKVQYGTESFDERHWQIIESYAKTAVKNGVNMLLTPIFTPALDTAVGRERPTTQLVDVQLQDGVYTFGFEKLGRWVDMCDRIGVQYLEIAHFFTQWGAEHAPKVMATVDGEYRRIFGWDTDAAGEEYGAFLQALIPALLAFLREKNGWDKRCFFHISDEPSEEHLPQYAAARAQVTALLRGYPIMDALSNYEFYERGVVDIPVAATDHIEPFLAHKVEGLWCYYCVGQSKKVSNRFVAMPSARNRILGAQMYKYGIAGFLHWGYNFYFSQFSMETVNPLVITDGDYFAPAGDTFSVYPAPDGTPYASLRLEVFHDGLQDMRALALCENLYGRDYTLQLLEQDTDGITFSEYPRDGAFLPAMRERVNAAIAKKA